MTIRPAAPQDVSALLSLIRELAEYERLSDEVVATEESLREVLFGERPVAEAFVADMDGELAGYALIFSSCSTFLARAGIYLEDLYVRPHLRRRGIGRAMLVYIARLAVERGCGRLEWATLNWNKPAIEFYESIGARALEEWTTFRLTGDPLRKLAALSR